MNRWVIVAIVVVVLLFLLMRTNSGQRLAGQFPFPPGNFIRTNWGRGYQGGS